MLLLQLSPFMQDQLARAAGWCKAAAVCNLLVRLVLIWRRLIAGAH